MRSRPDKARRVATNIAKLPELLAEFICSQLTEINAVIVSTSQI